MRRPLLATCLTVLLLVAVLRYELTVHAQHIVVAARPAAVPPATPAAGAATPHSGRHATHNRSRTATASRGTPSRTSTPRHRSATSASSSTTHRARSTPAPAGPTGTYTGTPSGTPYGVVQVQIKVSNGRITDVVALQMPNNSPRSQALSSQAGPQLRQEALNAQSANIDDVSGATYTSDGYKQSLQAAIDQAHL